MRGSLWKGKSCSMRKIYEAAVLLVGTIAWWGFVYPDMCLTEDAYIAHEEEWEQELSCEPERETASGQKPGEAEEQKQQDARSRNDFRSSICTEVEETWNAQIPKEDRMTWGTDAPEWKVGGIRIKSRLAEYVYQ